MWSSAEVGEVVLAAFMLTPNAVNLPELRFLRLEIALGVRRKAALCCP
jgi:hypothetical protein